MLRIYILILVLFFAGCSPLEIGNVFGIGTKAFREKGKIYTKTFEKDIFSCYTQTRKFLEHIGASFYRGSRKKNFMVMTHFNGIFLQCNESTEVAIFFKEIDKFKTNVEVSSLNYSLSEFVSAKLFKELEKKGQ
jgi:hypothetical protein